jgi:hypothetical protein
MMKHCRTLWTSGHRVSTAVFTGYEYMFFVKGGILLTKMANKTTMPQGMQEWSSMSFHIFTL